MLQSKQVGSIKGKNRNITEISSSVTGITFLQYNIIEPIRYIKEVFISKDKYLDV